MHAHLTLVATSYIIKWGRRDMHAPNILKTITNCNTPKHYSKNGDGAHRKTNSSHISNCNYRLRDV